MWKCPACGRGFKNTNQSHSCKTYSLDHHLRNRRADTVALFHVLSEQLEGLGDVEVVPMKGSILFRGETTFCSVSLGRTFLRVYFQLNRPVERDVHWRVSEVSPGRFVHEVRVTHPEEIDADFQHLLLEAARLARVNTRGQNH